MSRTASDILWFFFQHNGFCLHAMFTVLLLCLQDEFLLVYKTVRDYVETTSENVYYNQWNLTKHSQSLMTEDVNEKNDRQVCTVFEDNYTYGFQQTPFLPDV